MKDRSLPSISVVIATHNSSRTISRCLESIRSQTYPRQKVEIIVADGASTDDTRSIAMRFGIRWVAVDPKKQNAEFNKAMGIAAAKNEIIAMIDHDNVLPHREWFRRMVAPFVENREVVGVETLRYHYDPHASLLDRYFALFGAGDPLVWYLGKADRLSYIYDTYVLSGQAMDCGAYYLVRFRPETMTTIGANGFLVRRDALLKYASVAPGEYFDMDVNVDLIRNGFDTYAFVKDSILHLSGYGNIMSFLKRRFLFVTQYRFGVQKNRRFGSVAGKDRWRLLWAVLACATGIVPLYHSTIGWRKVRDSAWFLHPLLCISFVFIYGYAVGKKLLAR